jgi:type 1 glutamine amidotransferase
MIAPRVLMILGQSPAQEAQFHNRPEHWASLASHLRGADCSRRVITDDLSVLTPEVLAGFDVIVNASTALDPTAEQIDALLDRIHAGAGFVGVHAATATFVQHPNYLAMVGARFAKHDPLKHFTIRIVDHTHPISAGLEDYEHDDELYELTGDYADRSNIVPLQEGIHVLAEAEGHPMAYVKTHGAGRVVYLASGHDARSLNHPAFKALFTRGVAWAAGTFHHAP